MIEPIYKHAAVLCKLHQQRPSNQQGKERRWGEFKIAGMKRGPLSYATPPEELTLLYFLIATSKGASPCAYIFQMACCSKGHLRAGRQLVIGIRYRILWLLLQHNTQVTAKHITNCCTLVEFHYQKKNQIKNVEMLSVMSSYLVGSH